MLKGNLSESGYPGFKDVQDVYLCSGFWDLMMFVIVGNYFLNQVVIERSLFVFGFLGFDDVCDLGIFGYYFSIRLMMSEIQALNANSHPVNPLILDILIQTIKILKP